MKILLAEATPTPRRKMRRALVADGVEVLEARDGHAALEQIRASPVDAVIANWMLPRLDGMELIREIRALPGDPPPVILCASMETEAGRDYALDSGADEFLVMPVADDALVAIVRTLVSRSRQNRTASVVPPTGGAVARVSAAPTTAVAITTNTGGPTALKTLFSSLSGAPPAVFFLVMQGQPFVVRALVKRLEAHCPLRIRVAEDGDVPEPGDLVVCLRDAHLALDPATGALALSDAEPVNFVRPSADVTFRSVANVHREGVVALVLTGIGRDGVEGVGAVAEAGGRVLVEDPATATATAMPQSVVSSGVPHDVVDLAGMAETLARTWKAEPQLSS